jgi:TolA-binding protein
MRRACYLLLAAIWLVDITAVPLRADQADDQFAVAAGHYSAERWELAADEFRDFLSQFGEHPRAVEATFFLAEAHVQQEKWEDARTLFADVLAEKALANEHRRQALFRHGEAALFLGDDTTAKRQFETFLQDYPVQAAGTPPQAAYVLPYLAEVLQRAGQADAARRHYEQCLRQFPQGPMAGECRLGLAEIDRHAGKLESATAQLSQLGKSNDESIASRALFSLGDLHNSGGEYQKACESFASFAERFPRHQLAGHAAVAHAWALYKQQKYTAAKELLQSRVLADSPPTAVDDALIAEARYWSGMAHFADGAYDEAYESFADAGTALPDRLKPAALYHRAQCRLQVDQLAEADELFDQLLTQCPDAAYADDALFGKMQSAIKQAKHDSAIALARQFVEQFADSPLNAEGQCQAALAVCHARLAQWQQSEQALSQLAEMPNQSSLLHPTRYNVAEAAFHAGKYDLAASLFQVLSTIEDAESAADWAPRGLIGLALVRTKQGEHTESIESLERLLKNFPQHEVASVAALTLGEALEQLQHYDAALVAYRRAIADYPKSPPAPRAALLAAALHARLKQFDEADKLYAKFQEQSADRADWPTGLLNWGSIAAQQGQPQLAAERWQRLAEQHATHHAAAEALYQLAIQACEAQQFAECKKYLSQLAEHPLLAESNDNSADLAARRLYLTAKLAIAQQQWDQLDPPLNELLAKHPQHELALPAKFWLAEGCYRRNEFAKAANQFASLTETFKARDANWSAKAALRHAQSLAQLGKWSEARELAEAIQRDYADFAEQHEVDYLIGRCFANEAEFAQAREAYARVVNSKTANKSETAAMAQFMTAETHFHAEQYAAALKAYLRVEVLYAYPTWQAAALLQAGKCNEQLNQWQHAAEAYSRLLRVYPNSAVAEEAASRLGLVQSRVATRNKSNATTESIAE